MKKTKSITIRGSMGSAALKCLGGGVDYDYSIFDKTRGKSTSPAASVPTAQPVTPKPVGLKLVVTKHVPAKDLEAFKRFHTA